MGLLAGSPNASGSSSVKERQVSSWTTYGDVIPSFTLARLQANIQSGKPIRYDDINTLRILLNNMVGHFHNWYDLYQSGDIDNYGGFGDGNYARPGNLTNSATSNQFSTAGNEGDALVWHDSTTIHHIDQNNFATLSNSFISHTHTYTDQTTG